MDGFTGVPVIRAYRGGLPITCWMLVPLNEETCRIVLSLLSLRCFELLEVR